VRRQSTQDWFNYTLDDVNQSATRLPIHVARLQLGVTTVRLRADVRNRARNLHQPTVTLTLTLALTLTLTLTHTRTRTRTRIRTRTRTLYAHA
jgi:hypothetical protein